MALLCALATVPFQMPDCMLTLYKLPDERMSSMVKQKTMREPTCIGATERKVAAMSDDTAAHR